jgi:hypothetical protein
LQTQFHVAAHEIHSNLYIFAVCAVRCMAFDNRLMLFFSGSHSSFWAPMNREDFTVESISPAGSFLQQFVRRQHLNGWDPPSSIMKELINVVAIQQSSNKFLATKISEHTICKIIIHRPKTKYSDQDAYWLPLCLVGCQVNSSWRKGKKVQQQLKD